MAFITKSADRESLEAALNSVIMLIFNYKDRASNFPKQKVYWDNRIRELDEALKPILSQTSRD